MKREHIVRVDPSRCIGCKLCVSDCPTSAIRLVDGKAVATMQGCILCGHCQAICPQYAVSISGFAEAPEEITPEMRVDPLDQGGCPHAELHRRRAGAGQRQRAGRDPHGLGHAGDLGAHHLGPIGQDLRRIGAALAEGGAREARHQRPQLLQAPPGHEGGGRL